MNREIGSEFWFEGKHICKYADTLDNMRVTLSGRTALDYIIKDIRKARTLSKVLLPSYCCDSMIEPFERNGIQIQFYPITEDSIIYPENDADVVLVLDYFGYENPSMTSIAEKARKSGKVVIYDATHKINGLGFPADYVFCSYRKWTFSNYAVIIKNGDDFCLPQPRTDHTEYVQMRKKAAFLKTRYMNGEPVDKQEFLQLFSRAEELLEIDYINYRGEISPVDVDQLVNKRRQNAQYLIDGLKSIKGICLWKPWMAENDAPLFVPILVNESIRNDLRKYLIRNNIYCPIHWSLTEKHGACTDIYNKELSLICDQRYTLNDMAYEVATIRDFFENKQGEVT